MSPTLWALGRRGEHLSQPTVLSYLGISDVLLSVNLPGLEGPLFGSGPHRVLSCRAHPGSYSGTQQMLGNVFSVASPILVIRPSPCLLVVPGRCKKCSKRDDKKQGVGIFVHRQKAPLPWSRNLPSYTNHRTTVMERVDPRVARGRPAELYSPPMPPVSRPKFDLRSL